MRPTPAEVIAGVRAILKSDIGPKLPPQAQPQIKRLVSVLRDGHWNEAAFELIHENAVFAGLARSNAARLGVDSPQTALAAELTAAADFSLPRSFAEANAINRRLREALVTFIEIVRDEKLVALDTACDTIGAALLQLRSGGETVKD